MTTTIKPQKSAAQDFFLFQTGKNNHQGDNRLARSNYSFKKRQKELARKEKKEQKRLRKLEKDADTTEETSEHSDEEASEPSPDA